MLASRRIRRLRLLLADPPIEWENVRTPQDWIAWNSRRVVHAANLIRTEVLQPRRRALMVFGDGHHQRKMEGAFDADMKPMLTLRNRIEQDEPGSVFSIWTNTTVPLELLDSSASYWPVPHLRTLERNEPWATELQRIRGHPFNTAHAGPVRRDSPFGTAFFDHDV